MRPDDPVQTLKGVGEKTAESLNKLGIMTVRDLLLHYPRTYDRMSAPVPVMQAREMDYACVSGVITGKVSLIRTKSMVLATATLQDQVGDKLKLRWFRAPWIRNSVYPELRAVFRGKMVRNGNTVTMDQPEIFSVEEYKSLVHTMRPVYALTSGITSKMISKLVRQVLDQTERIPESLSSEVVSTYGLMPLDECLRQMHFPEDDEAFYLARRRLGFEEFYRFLLQIGHMKEHMLQERNPFAIPFHSETRDLIEKLPFPLTGAQKRVLAEIQKDLEGPYLMNRLVQGDVGSGKTILAFLSLYEVYLSGYQGAFMAPTEVLARQHYQKFLEWNELYDLKLRIGLLTGSVTGKKRKELLKALEAHEIDLLIGTHALIEDPVRFHELALVVTDEQHRFGVHQREALLKKGLKPHVLVMSATPIPRTLAMVLYGDFAVSIVDEVPAKRLPIKTAVVSPSYRPNSYRFIQKEIEAGRQAYVICPMVEESELYEGENATDYAKKLKSVFPDSVSVGLLHGKMKPDKKTQIMDAFAAKEISVLVSTTVIEVGIDVPNASVILIENAERFGLAQLHQLRGRVGRGTAQSYCILVNTSGKEDASKRLEVLRTSSDGFKIAEEDMKLRGPGDFFGVRQSGAMEFAMADIYSDADLLAQAGEAAKRFPDGLLEDFTDLQVPSL